MDTLKLKVECFGDDFGAVIPDSVVKDYNLKEDEVITLIIIKDSRKSSR